MSDAAARPAAVDEIELVLELVRQSQTERLTERGGAVLERLEPRPPIDREGLTNDSVLVALGTYCDVPFGFAHATLASTDASSVVHLHDLFVEPGARGVGVGEALLELVLDWARTLDATGIDSLVLPGNREGKNFFERFGLVARAIHVYRELDRDQ